MAMRLLAQSRLALQQKDQLAARRTGMYLFKGPQNDSQLLTPGNVLTTVFATTLPVGSMAGTAVLTRTGIRLVALPTYAHTI